MINIRNRHGRTHSWARWGNFSNLITDILDFNMEILGRLDNCEILDSVDSEGKQKAFLVFYCLTSLYIYLFLPPPLQNSGYAHENRYSKGLSSYLTNQLQTKRCFYFRMVPYKIDHLLHRLDLLYI